MSSSVGKYKENLDIGGTGSSSAKPTDKPVETPTEKPAEKTPPRPPPGKRFWDYESPPRPVPDAARAAADALARVRPKGPETLNAAGGMPWDVDSAYDIAYGRHGPPGGGCGWVPWAQDKANNKQKKK